MEIGEVRYYKGKAACVVEIVSKVKGRHRSRNVMVKFLEDFDRWRRGDRIVTVPRLLWRAPRK